MTRLLLPLAASAILLGLFVASSAPDLRAQIPGIDAPGKYKEPFAFVQQDLPAQSDVNAYTVPNGRRLVITDFLVSNGSLSDTLVGLSKGTAAGASSLTHPIIVPAHQTLSFQFAAGLTLESGAELLVGTGAGNQALSVTLLGYLRK